MTSSGTYPKLDGDILYGKDINMAYYQAAMAATLNFDSVNVSTSATQIVAVNSSRKGVIIRNNGSVDVYLGLASVTTSTGFKLVVGKSIYLNNKEVIYGITASGTADMRFLEAQ